jgi:hypothetical protein
MKIPSIPFCERQGDTALLCCIYAEGPHSALLGFTARLGQECAGAVGGKGARALDIGCSVGGASFELRRHFDTVLGIGFSHAFTGASKEY